MLRRSLFTKLLQAALFLAVAHQLFLVGLVQPPEGASAGNAFFAWHQNVGLLTMGIVSAFWLWARVRRSETAAVPWFRTCLHDGERRFGRTCEITRTSCAGSG